MCGKELAGQRVVLQILLTSCLSQTLTISSLTVNPQPGFDCEAQPQELTSLLPLRVSPIQQIFLMDPPCIPSITNSVTGQFASRSRPHTALLLTDCLASCLIANMLLARLPRMHPPACSASWESSMTGQCPGGVAIGSAARWRSVTGWRRLAASAQASRCRRWPASGTHACCRDAHCLRPPAKGIAPVEMEEASAPILTGYTFGDYVNQSNRNFTQEGLLLGIFWSH